MVLMLVAALTVDLGNTWARRGQLQTQADNAAIFAANYLPAATPAPGWSPPRPPRSTWPATR